MAIVPKREPPSAVLGAGAVGPRHLPPRAWLHILRRVMGRVMDDRFTLYAAAVAFCAVLSIAPVLLTALSVYGAINTPEQAMNHLSAVVTVLPPALGDVLADQLVSITAASTRLLTARGVFSLAVALATAMAAMNFLIDALTVAYCEQETRSMPQRNLLALTFVLGGAVGLGAVITGSAFVTRGLAAMPDPLRGLGLAALWVTLASLMAVALTVLYRYAPDRRGRAKWGWIGAGSIASTVLWLAVSAALFVYVQNLGTYERTYGSLAGVAISMLWLFITVLLVILGAAVNAEAERQTARDSTVGDERPPGERGAVVADDVPPQEAGRG
ncbi:MAG: YihY/virulence factor BrkB family protein [Ornithinimicrobium sp.]